MEKLDKMLIEIGIGVSILVAAGIVSYVSMCNKMIDADLKAVEDYVIKPVVSMGNFIQGLENNDEKREN